LSDILTYYIWLLLLCALLFNTLYLGYLLLKLVSYKSEASTSPLPFISVVVCIKDGKALLPKLIAALKGQQYPDYEIILVDDGSTDGTWEWLQARQKQDRTLSIYRIEDTRPGKKEALLYGLGKAGGKWVAVTDVDCVPGMKWLDTMARQIDGARHFILGYSPYSKRKGLLNKLIRHETLLTAIQYLGWATAGLPYMGVGRNMMYRKQWIHGELSFLRMDLSSGDDDLLIASKGNGGNTGVCLDRESFVWSAPKETWRGWWRQKARHVSTARHYLPWQRFILGLYGMSQIGLLLGIPALFSIYWKWVLLGFVFRYLFLGLLGRKVWRLLEGRDLLIWFPLLDMGMSALYLSLIVPGLIHRRKGW